MGFTLQHVKRYFELKADIEKAFNNAYKAEQDVSVKDGQVKHYFKLLRELEVEYFGKDGVLPKE